MTWYGAFDGVQMLGVAALQYALNVALLRHCYLLPSHQRQGTGTLLTRALESAVTGVERIVVGTYAGNYKARGALEKLGYRECIDSGAVLTKYYALSDERLTGSVAYEKQI